MMPNTESETGQLPHFELLGGNIGLDFINTLDDRPSGRPTELLASYEDVLRFAQEAGFLSSRDAGSLLGQAQASPRRALAALRTAIDLRESMHAVFSAIVERRRVAAADLERLNAHVQEAASHARLLQVKGRFEYRFEYAASLDSPRWAIAHEAAELLASDRLPFIRACSAPTCRWMFLDSSKNHHRRWCDMKLCGNRAKVRSFYARKKAESGN